MRLFAVLCAMKAIHFRLSAASTPAYQRCPGMLNDFVVVTLTRPGPLSVRLKPDPRGLVILNNFDSLPDDPHTSCPRLGPLESVGNVMPGDALVSLWLRVDDVSSLIHSREG